MNRLLMVFSHLRRLPRTLPQHLETHWSRPAYSGGLLGGLALCFFGAATNTMAGWLYVISGLIFALLVIGAILPPRSLRSLKVQRKAIEPITVGDELVLELAITNPTSQPQTLLQVSEQIPPRFGSPQWRSIEAIAPRQTFHCTTSYAATRRGVYHWSGVQLRTAAPLGLFWARRSRPVPGRAIIYPQVLPLQRCALVDTLAQEQNLQLQRDRQYHNATEGITKTLRPYRIGDPTRLIHWRTSARFDQLQVRELEVMTTGREVIIALDNGNAWPDEDTFEQAVTAAASLYFYASRCQLSTQLWTASQGLVKGNRVVLETLAAVQVQTHSTAAFPLDAPLLCLTAQASRLQQLPSRSHYLLFNSAPVAVAECRGFNIEIGSDRSLEQQLSQSLR